MENARFLAGRVDDVELVLFDLPGASNLPDRETVARLADAAEEGGLTYTLHLPTDALLAHHDPAVRAAGIEKCLRFFERTAGLPIFAHILHFYWDADATDPPGDLPAWRGHAAGSLEKLIAGGLPGDLLCVESLNYPFVYVEPVVREFGVPVCLDVGNLLQVGENVPFVFSRHADAVRVVHLHGFVPGEDHLSIEGVDRSVLEFLCRFLSDGQERVLTVEVFTDAHLSASLNILDRILESGQGGR